MPKIDYTGWRPSRNAAEALEAIARVNEICRDFRARGYSITLRQLHYQFVTHNWHPNTDRAYKNLGQLVSNARRAGLIDWYDVEDRTRFLRSRTHWDDPAQIINAAARGFDTDRWEDQRTRVEVWVEKDALIDVIQQAADTWDVPSFSCRGYTSDSEMWTAARRLRGHLAEASSTSDVVVLHLGDHDPSGLDMTRDIRDRLSMFMESWAPYLEVRRIALNMDQIEQYQPPPNPAKLTDSRGDKYVEEYGTDSWELDALDPDVLTALISDHITGIVDHRLYQEHMEEAQRQRDQLVSVTDRWNDVVAYLGMDL